MILDSFCLFHFAWPRVSSGSEGLYLSPLSDMSPATSDCLETYFSGGFILFSNYRVCVVVVVVVVIPYAVCVGTYLSIHC